MYELQSKYIPMGKKCRDTIARVELVIKKDTGKIEYKKSTQQMVDC